MRLSHFRAFAPLCPDCLTRRDRPVPLALGPVVKRVGEDILEGILHCADPSCFLEYPIIDGIPVILPDARGYLATQIGPVMAREDLSPLLEGLIGDATGPGSAYDLERQHISTYAWDGYGAADPAERMEPNGPNPGAVLRCLARAFDLAGIGGEANDAEARPALDLGCAVGASTFALAERSCGPVLGIDRNFVMLRLARRVLTTGRVSYPRRRGGVVYDRREFAFAPAAAERVDFWVCDAMTLPFAAGGIAIIVALNILDCLPAPREFLAGTTALLHPGGRLLLATPYDWSAAVTPFEQWIGGHSQRGEGGGAGEPFLRALLTPGAHPLSIAGLRLLGEDTDFPWQTRLHERSSVAYRVHILALSRVA